MARLGFGGAESKSTLVEKLTAAGTVNIDTTTPHGGVACFEHPNGPTSSRLFYAHTNVTNRAFYGRVWVYFSGNPAADVQVAAWSVGQTYRTIVTLLTSGKMQAADGTQSAVLSAGWHCVELSCTYNGTQIHSVTRLDGTQLGSDVGVTSAAPDRFTFGNITGATHSVSVRTDDWAVNDDQGASQNSWPGTLGVVLAAIPVSDSAVGSDWKLGGGSTPSSNTYDAVNNRPPVGLAPGSATDSSQIKDAVSNTTNPNADADVAVQSYTTAGLPSGGTVTATCAAIAAGQGTSTTINVATKIVSNPADGSENQANNGATSVSTFPTGWIGVVGPVTTAPTVTAGTSPVVRIGKRTASAINAHCCFAGLYFEYEPPVYTDTGSGGFTLAGSSSEVRVYVGTGSGGFTLAGSDSEVRVYIDTGTGGLTLAGSASELFGQGDVASGGFTLAGSATEEHLFTDAMSGGFTLGGSASEALAFDDTGSGGFTLAGSGVDDWSVTAAPPEPTPLQGLDWHVTGLWYPEAETVDYYGRIADPQDGSVRIPLNDSRTAQVTVSAFDADILAAVIGHTYARMLKVYYHGDLVFWGPINLVTTNPDEPGTVTLNAVDPSIRLIHHFVRRGDIGGLLGADTQDRAYVTIDHIGLRLLRDSGLNTTEQTTRGVPDLGIVDGTNTFPPAAATDLMGVARGDQTWEAMLELSRSLGPDFDLEPVDGTPGVYCQLNTYAAQGNDVSSSVQFHYGTGLDNLDGLQWTEGSKYTTHVQVLDRDKKYRITPANLATSADTGPYVDWVVTEYDVQGMSQDDAEAVLEQYGLDVLAAYSVPLIVCTLTLPIETAASLRYLRDFIVGDIIGVAGLIGLARSPEADYRIVAVELNQDGPENAMRPAIEVVSSRILDVDTEG